MLHSILLALGILMGPVTSLHATSISFTVSSLGSNTYEYTYTVINDTLASAIGEFTVFFDFGLYENLTVTTPVAGWDEIAVNPDLVFGVPDVGFYDAQALMAGIAPGSTVNNFSVRFDWLGAATPGAQFFEVIEPTTSVVLDAGTTIPADIPIPEPGTLLLFTTGLFALAFIRVRVRRTKQYNGYVGKRMNSHWSKKFLRVSTLLFFLIFPLYFSSSRPALAQSSFLTIGNYTLINKVRAGRTTYDYTFRANITNNGSENAVNVSAILTSLTPTLTIVEGSLVFGNIPAGATVVSNDTFTVRIDRQSPFNAADFSWEINGTNVIGPGGGTVSSPGGAKLILPPASLVGTTTINLQDQTLAGLNISLPQGYSFLGAVSINLGSARLTQEADLEIPVVTPPVGQVIVARIVQFGATRFLTLVDTATFVGSGFLRTNSPPFPGVRTSGDFVFLAMPTDLGIIGTYITSSSGTPIEGALVSVQLKSPGTQATPFSTNHSIESFDTFIGQSDETGFAAVPGGIPHSEVAALAISPNQPSLPQLGTGQFSLGDIFINGLLGNQIQNLVTNHIFNTNNLPDAPPQCPCISLTVVPLEIPGPGGQFLPGSTQNLVTLCGSQDVTTTTDSPPLIDVLTTGASVNITHYYSANPQIATVDEKTAVVTAKSPGSTVIGVTATLLSLYKLGNLVLPHSCSAVGKVDPVTVGGLSTIQVIQASYGNHCGNATGNVTGIVAAQCDGQTTCDVFVDNSVFGDPFYGCPKDFDVAWLCTGFGVLKTAYHGPVVNEGYAVDLTCP